MLCNFASPGAQRAVSVGDRSEQHAESRPLDDQGVQVDDGKPTVNDDMPKLIQVGLTAVTGKKYKVIYRIVALDGHKVKGEFSFSVK